MSENTATITYLAIAAVLLAAAVWKAFILRRQPGPEFALQTAVHGLGGIVYIVASPWGYRAVGSAVGQPWLPTLLVYLGILFCFGTWHILTILWTPTDPNQPGPVRRTITGWILAYAVSMTIMTVAFSLADLQGRADPLRFNTEQVDEPHVLVFLGVFLFMLGCGTLTASRRSRRARPDDETLMHALRWYSASHLMTFGYVVCSAPAIAAAATGHHQLDSVGVLGAACGSAGTIMLCYGMAGAAASKWLAERRDIALLQPLWDLVVTEVDQGLSLDPRQIPQARNPCATGNPQRSKLSRLINVRWTLHRMLIEILDGIRELERRGLVHDLPEQAVHQLHAEAQKTAALKAKGDTSKSGALDLEAAATAAVLRDAVERLSTAGPDRAKPVKAAESTVFFVPGKATPAAEERERLVRVARALGHPLVDASLKVVRSVHDTDGARQGSATAR